MDPIPESSHSRSMDAAPSDLVNPWSQAREMEVEEAWGDQIPVRGLQEAALVLRARYLSRILSRCRRKPPSRPLFLRNCRRQYHPVVVMAYGLRPPL